MAATSSLTALIVQDQASPTEELARALHRAGFAAREARGEDDAVRRAAEISPDVVIVDLAGDQRSISGVVIRLRELPASEHLPIIVLTARDELATRVALLELGCDDCLVKPCEPDELIARVHALVRRHEADRNVRRIGPLRVQLASGDAWLGARPLDLTAGERAILSTLARAYPSVAHRTALDRLPWRAAGDVSSNVTEVLVARLRQKLAAAGGGVEIRTIRRTGYRMQPAGAIKLGV